MKTSLFLLIILFTSCTKCATCTRNWTYTSYQYSDNNSAHKNPSTTYSTETFDLCGGEDIDNAEKATSSHSQNIISTTSSGVNTYIVTDGKSSCHCSIK